MAADEVRRFDGPRFSDSLRRIIGFAVDLSWGAAIRFPDFPGHLRAGLPRRSRGVMGQEASAVEPAQPADYSLHFYCGCSGAVTADDGRACGVPAVLATRFVRDL